ncbi:MAG: hypothetical protein IJ774_10580 [Selenomonadaceae bacterium]|nr:hypothetical protein [Selenomonadaceae bacterium]
MFDITYGQKELFEQKGLNLPTRCENCRGKPTLSRSDIFSLMRNKFR